MLEQAVLDDINASPAAGSITRSMLEQAVLDDINASPAAGSITRSMLEQAVLDFRWISMRARQQVSITRSMLEQAVLDDINAARHWFDNTHAGAGGFR